MFQNYDKKLLGYCLETPEILEPVKEIFRKLRQIGRQSFH